MLLPCRHVTCTTTSTTVHFFRLHNHHTIHTISTTDDSRSETRNSTSTCHSVLSLSLQDKANVNLLLGRRNPIFPGSVSTLIESKPEHNATSNSDDNYDQERVMRAIEVRRKVVFEILMEAMRKGKFGVTYSKNLVGRLDGFIDCVLVEAAAMKRVPEFREESFNSRVRVLVEDSNVVPLIRWLKHNSLPYTHIAKLICMSGGNLKLIRCLVEWLKSIHVKGRFLGVALIKAGDNILNRGIDELDQIVEYLESNGVRGEWMGYVMSRSPELLSFSMDEVKSRVGFYLEMGMNEKDFGTMVFDYPKALGYFTMEAMNEKVNYLKEFGLSNEDVRKLLAFKPQLMGCSIEDRWKPLIKYMYYLGITRDGMRRMLIIKPMVFCVDLETIIVPKVLFFQDIGIRDDAIGNMLVKFPPLLTYSLHKKIRPVVIFLITRAGVSEKDIAKVIASGPELLGCSIVNKLEVNMKYFLSLGIHLRQLGEMIADFPMLLRYNVDLLRPKYRYLRRTMVRPLQDVIEFPRFFSYSLEGRIIPRHKVLVENRLNFRLRYMLAGSDEEFDGRVKAAIERRHRFESGVSSVVDGDSHTTALDFPVGVADSSCQALDCSKRKREIDCGDDDIVHS